MSDTIWIETYRRNALRRDITAMSGRPKRGYVNEFIASRIAASLAPEKGESIMDVGCGDGSALIAMLNREPDAHYIGVLPTDEEVARLRNHLSSRPIEIIRGTTSDITLPDRSIDKLACNSVLQLVSDVPAALREFARLTRPGALLYLGEILCRDEAAFETTLLQQQKQTLPYYRIVIDRLRKEGPQAIWLKLRKMIFGARTIYAPLFHTTHDMFVTMAKDTGLELLSSMPHVSLDSGRNEVASPTRMDFIFRRV